MCIRDRDNALSVKQFLASKNITVLEHPPYSPDLAPVSYTHLVHIKDLIITVNFKPRQKSVKMSIKMF